MKAEAHGRLDADCEPLPFSDTSVVRESERLMTGKLSELMDQLLENAPDSSEILHVVLASELRENSASNSPSTESA